MTGDSANLRSRRSLFRIGSGSRGDREPNLQLDGDDARANGTFVKATRPAMGSYFELRIPAETPGALDLANRALDLLDSLEQQMSIYRADSELSRLNQRAYEEPVTVEPRLFDALREALQIHDQTEGAYDIATGALSRAWGFLGGSKRVPEPDTLENARERSGRQHVDLDEEKRTLRFTRHGIELDPGSFGKGYALDRIAEVIRNHWWPCSALIHGGGSSIYAFGSPTRSVLDSWPIAVRNPLLPSETVAWLSLDGHGVGTSGDLYQRFESGGRTYGHILDPRTGRPHADETLSVSVVTPDAMRADALSTAFTILGVERSTDYCRHHSEVGALFVLRGPSPSQPRCVPINLPPSMLRLAESSF